MRLEAQDPLQALLRLGSQALRTARQGPVLNPSNGDIMQRRGSSHKVPERPERPMPFFPSLQRLIHWRVLALLAIHP